MRREMDSELFYGEFDNDMDLLYRLLRDEAIEIRLTAFDAMIRLLAEGDSFAVAMLADFVGIIRVEIIPNLAEESDPEKRGALSHVLESLLFLSKSVSQAENLILLTDSCIELFKHPSPRIEAVSIRLFSAIYILNPSELDDTTVNKLLRFLVSHESEVRLAAVSAWCNICDSTPERVSDALSAIYKLLTDSDANVRAEAAGYFYNLAKNGVADCRVALPLLRTIRDTDPNNLVRERASAAVQAIDNSVGELF